MLTEFEEQRVFTITRRRTRLYGVIKNIIAVQILTS